MPKAAAQVGRVRRPKGPALEVRHERAACRVCPLRHRITRLDRPMRRAAQSRCRGRADLCRPRADRHQSGTSRASGGARCLSRRGHAGSDQARPARPIPARRSCDRRGTDPAARQPLTRWLRIRPHGRRGSADVQRAGHGRGVRVRLDPVAHPRRRACGERKGRLRGRQPKLIRRQEAHLVSLVHSGEYSTAEVADLSGVGRSTVYRAIQRQRTEARAGTAASATRR